MEDTSAVSVVPLEAISLKLRSIWIVQADKKYDILLNPDVDDYIMIRTAVGQGRLIFRDGHETLLGPETLTIIPFSSLKRYHCVDDVWNFWWFTFSVDPTDRLPIGEVLHTPVLTDEKDRVCMCLHLFNESNFYKQNYAAHLFGVLLFQWLLDSDQSETLDMKNGDLIDKCASYIKNNFNKNISVRELADRCGLCENQFRQLFIRRHGLSPKQFHMHLKMNCAKNLLTNTTLSIAEISDFLSFSNQFYFSKIFSRQVGVTPSEYRKSNSA